MSKLPVSVQPNSKWMTGWLKGWPDDEVLKMMLIHLYTIQLICINYFNYKLKSDWLIDWNKITLIFAHYFFFFHYTLLLFLKVVKMKKHKNKCLWLSPIIVCKLYSLLSTRKSLLRSLTIGYRSRAVGRLGIDSNTKFRKIIIIIFSFYDFFIMSV